jgi:hypothetical protein
VSSPIFKENSTEIRANWVGEDKIYPLRQFAKRISAATASFTPRSGALVSGFTM